MKTIYPFLIFMFTTGISFSQLSVQPNSSQNSYIYVKGNVVFVSGAVNLQKNTGNPETTASFYLREGAQLIQGTTGNTVNSGDGLLSVFQEGTSNAYDYNYWASPVSNSDNRNFGVKMLFSPKTPTSSDQAVISSDLNGTASPLTISSRWIYTYSGTTYSDWNFIGGETSIPPGYGFTMKGVNGIDNTAINGRKNNPGNAQRYDFRGTPNNGEIKIPVVEGQNILIGNPYPSALDLSLFLLENSGSGELQTNCYGTTSRKNNITGIAYFWDSKENGNSHYLQDYVGGYGAFSPVSPCTEGIYQRPVFKSYKTGVETGEQGKFYERRYSPIGQGFIVEGASNAEIEFNNHQRIFKKEGENSEFKAAEDKAINQENTLIAIPKFKLEVEINHQYIRQLTLAFWKTATPGIDIAMDAKSYSLEATDVGWLQNTESYVIDVRPFEELEKIPLFLKVGKNGADLKFTVAKKENFSTENIYIYDQKSDSYYPVKDSEFKISLEPGEYHNRFQICFQQGKKYLPILETEAEMSIFQNNINGQLEIRNIDASEIRSVSIYNLKGERIFYKTDFHKSGEFNFSTKNLTNSIYIVKIISKNNPELIKKIVIFN